MSKQINIGIVGFGNLGKGVVAALQHSSEFFLKGIFTRRNPQQLKELEKDLPFHPMDEIESFVGKIDLMFLCGGSAKDLPIQGPKIASLFHCIDSYDNHSKIPNYFEEINFIAKKANKLCLISAGWDPGLFSIHRLYAESILPNGVNYTFWGRGVSQGHSDAARQIEGVKRAISYTIPNSPVLEIVQTGNTPTLTTRQKHSREVFVVAKEDANLELINKQITTIPKYFDEYDTTVNFISEEEFLANHQSLPHGGKVIHNATSNSYTQTMEYSLILDSNPHFTGAVLVAFARALYQLAKENRTGALTVFDIAPRYLSSKTSEELRSELL